MCGGKVEKKKRKLYKNINSLVKLLLSWILANIILVDSLCIYFFLCVCEYSVIYLIGLKLYIYYCALLLSLGILL